MHYSLSSYKGTRVIHYFRTNSALLGLTFTAMLVACSESQFTGNSSNRQKNSQKASEPQDADSQGSKQKPDPKSKSKKIQDKKINSEADSQQKIPNLVDTNSLPDGQVRDEFKGESAASTLPVDIIFAVDTSGSMDDEKSSLESNMNRFIGKFTADAANLDYQIFMIGEDFRFPATSNKIKQIPLKVDSNDALAVLDQVLQQSSSNGIRTESLKQIVVVTDDNAEDVTSSEFKDFLQVNPVTSGKTKINGFVGLPTSRETETCELASIGHEYIKLGQDPELGGLIQDLCIQDWGQLLQNLAANIIAQSNQRDVFRLSTAADPSKPITVEVAGQTIDKSLFRYDPSSESIVFNAEHAPGNGEVVVVTYTPES